MYPNIAIWMLHEIFVSFKISYASSKNKNYLLLKQKFKIHLKVFY